MTMDPTTGSIGPAIPIRFHRGLQARIEQIAVRYRVGRSEAVRRLVEIGLGQYERELAPERSPIDGLADALDEVGRRVHEQFGVGRLDAWQVVGDWYVARSTDDFRIITGHAVEDLAAAKAANAAANKVTNKVDN